jgi:hypothetical protein
MNNQFDELTKNLAQSVTRRGALKKFGLGLAGMALACFGVTNKVNAATYVGYCEARRSPYRGTILNGNKWVLTGACIGIDAATGTCVSMTSRSCQTGGLVAPGKATPCGSDWSTKNPCSFTV